MQVGFFANCQEHHQLDFWDIRQNCRTAVHHLIRFMRWRHRDALVNLAWNCQNLKICSLEVCHQSVKIVILMIVAYPLQLNTYLRTLKILICIQQVLQKLGGKKCPKLAKNFGFFKFPEKLLFRRVSTV